MYMNYITTTQLRTKTSNLVDMILAGQSIQLIHRSSPVATISPIITQPIKIFNAERFGKLVDKYNFPKTTPAERESRYRDHLMKKYGKHLS
jgi:antitoxin (DNA-binding transcriptional repressor) of toxin-antitoxin stability system